MWFLSMPQSPISTIVARLLMSIFMVGLLSTIGVRWRSLALRRWSSSISWIAWDMHALIFGAIIGIVRIMVTIMLLTSLVMKVMTASCLGDGGGDS